MAVFRSGEYHVHASGRDAFVEDYRLQMEYRLYCYYGTMVKYLSSFNELPIIRCAPEY